MTIEGVREYKFDPKKVIEGLNEYYERRISSSFIRVNRDFVGGPVYLGPDVWLSALIEWLRVDNDIFYRPGLIFDRVEAARSAAKMCGLRAHIKDELDKRDLWFDKNADIPELVDTIFRAFDCCDERADENRKELKGIMSYICQEASRNGFNLPEEIDGGPLTVKRIFHDLLELLGKKEAQRKAVNDQRWKDLRDIYKELGCDGVYSNVDDFAKAVKARAEHVESLSRNAERETRKAVNEQLKKDTYYVADVLSTILEALGISKSNTVHLDAFGLKTKAIQRASVIKSEHDRYLEQLDKAAADYQALDKEYQELKNSQKSDTNKLIRECCTRHGIIAPSRYLSDRASVEYVFSLLDSYSKQRNEACADRDRAVDDYKLKLKDDILHDIKEHGYRYDGLETKSIEDIVDWIIEMATCGDKEVEDAKKETKRKCYWYLWEALRKLSPECDALKIDCYENLVDRIFYEMSLINGNCKRCQRKHSTEKFDYIRRANKAEEEVKKLKSANEANNDVIKKLRELLNEINKEEDGEWFKP